MCCVTKLATYNNMCCSAAQGHRRSKSQIFWSRIKNFDKRSQELAIGECVSYQNILEDGTE